MASYWVPVQWITTVLGKSHGHAKTSGSLPFPLDKRNLPDSRFMAERLYSMRKYHLRFLGGCASGSPAFLRSRQLLRLAMNASTQASAVWACSFGLVKSRFRYFSLSQIPLCLTVRQKKTSI